MVSLEVIYPGHQPCEMGVIGKGLLGSNPLFEPSRAFWKTPFRTLSRFAGITVLSPFSQILSPPEDYFLQIIIANCNFCNILFSSDICKLSSIHQLKALPW